MIVSRVRRVISAAALVTIAVPLCTTGCGSVAELGTRAAELRAANDSDLLEMPTERLYQLATFEITAPEELGSIGRVAESQLRFDGFILITDDLITAAEFEFGLVDWQQVRFTLTEPAVLRRAEGEVMLGNPLHAVGRLTVGEGAPQHTTVTIAPVIVDDEHVELEAAFSLPTGLIPPAITVAPAEVTARVSMVAVP
ncbi:MAG: hypothetical protein WDA07_09560 [Leucobacter sp.]